ncbi:MAG: hypothetical protein JST54_30925 [Deltaproteobacteria bacterium]|nr:hypothetical protein [Deltaproteobacteria bacterium]
MRSFIAAAIAAVALVGCASATPIPDDDRAKLENELNGRSRFLRVSLYEGPFWSDDSKELVSAQPPQELQLFTDAHGEVVPAPPAKGIVPAGRKVTITKVELPTGMVVAGRMPYTPRYNPWVYLHVEGESGDRPAILVLRSDLKSHDQFLTALDRLLTAEDPSPRLNAYADEIRAAISQKQVVRDMDAEAVEMAWGIPEHKSIDLKGGNRAEVWTYSGGKRKVTLSDGKVSAVDTGAAPATTPASGS